MRFTKEEIAEAITTIYSRLLAGLSDQEISDEMGLSFDEFLNFKRTMFEAKNDELKQKPDEYAYIEYIIEQGRNLKDLTSIIDEYKSGKNSQTAVAAIRARSDILDKVLTKGQDFGLIKREPSRKEIGIGIVVAELTKDKLKELIMGEIGEMNRLMKRYGDDSIIDVAEPKRLHFEGKSKKKKMLPPAKLSKRNKANSTKVHGARGRKKISSS